MQTAGGASVSFSADDDLVDAFDSWVEESQYGSRSEALRTLMAQTCDTEHDNTTPLAPPQDDRLGTAYKRLCEHASPEGYVRGSVALTLLASVLNIPKSEIRTQVLRKLHKRGYLRRQNNVYGDTSYQLMGWES
ncbi:ribbon-helix-helix domain-containing protein [Halomicrobium mukohataei]|uniref:Uncharacterized protein n=1 Tax=Halomicrobium mukohataei (strain ATCC 700874 / DSM 12286 / JCM 9738 / NCIMB 13541) TaxID=485914 RepID=C7NYG6_HALMD|nr:ribbon-helix-helix domain-containing protein [Halomicrobium mukohataei]ACV46627.1 hypothetical protein Hmuk_0493 [Halomicrobium mukohataei DSM 12286]